MFSFQISALRLNATYFIHGCGATTTVIAELKWWPNSRVPAAKALSRASEGSSNTDHLIPGAPNASLRPRFSRRCNMERNDGMGNGSFCLMIGRSSSECPPCGANGESSGDRRVRRGRFALRQSSPLVGLTSSLRQHCGEVFKHFYSEYIVLQKTAGTISSE